MKIDKKRLHRQQKETPDNLQDTSKYIFFNSQQEGGKKPFHIIEQLQITNIVNFKRLIEWYQKAAFYFKESVKESFTKAQYEFFILARFQGTQQV